jgi:hypothetical protein
MSKQVKNCGTCGKPAEANSDFVKTSHGLMVFHKDALTCADAPERKIADPFSKVYTNYSVITYTQLQYSGEGKTFLI